MLGRLFGFPRGKPEGVLRGEVGGYLWEVRLSPGPTSYGLNPRTLYKGGGRVTRLALYQRLGASGLTRKVAVYDHGWRFGRRKFMGAIRRLLRDLGA